VGLTRPDFPLASVDRVVSIFARGPLSYRDYVSLNGRTDLFEWLGAARVSPGTVTLAGQAAILSVAAVTPRLARELNLPLKQGIIISQRMRENELRAKADVRGEQLRSDGIEVQVAGVAPDSLEGLYRDRPVDLWMPLPEGSINPDTRNLWILGRLRQNISTEEAQVAIRARLTGSAELSVVLYTGMTPEMAQGISRVGTLLSFAAGPVFFIACANVAAFLLGRASARSHETSVRVALGASRGQLARGLLADSIVISIAGGALGSLLAMWTSRRSAGHRVKSYRQTEPRPAGAVFADGATAVNRGSRY